LTATSVGITARVLSDLRALGHRASRVILGAAVIDDVLGMLVLAVVFALAEGRVSWLRMGLITAEAVLFVVIIAWAGTRVVTRLRGPVHRMRTRSPGFAFALILCLGLSVAASRVDLAAIIGAFLAGLAFADHREEWGLEERVAGVSEFLTPFFFVMLGMRLDPGVFTGSGILGLAVLVTVVAILTKIIGCGAGALPLGFRDSARIGIGMVPRGEVGLIVALLGLQRGAISAEVYAVLLFMVAVTTVIAPFPLVVLFRKRGAESEPAPKES
jgi:Kef-type K+ transport system membrane component KefB